MVCSSCTSCKEGLAENPDRHLVTLRILKIINGSSPLINGEMVMYTGVVPGHQLNARRELVFDSNSGWYLQESIHFLHPSDPRTPRPPDPPGVFCRPLHRRFPGPLILNHYSWPLYQPVQHLLTFQLAGEDASSRESKVCVSFRRFELSNKKAKQSSSITLDGACAQLLESAITRVLGSSGEAPSSVAVPVCNTTSVTTACTLFDGDCIAISRYRRCAGGFLRRNRVLHTGVAVAERLPDGQVRMFVIHVMLGENGQVDVLRSPLFDEANPANSFLVRSPDLDPNQPLPLYVLKWKEKPGGPTIADYRAQASVSARAIYEVATSNPHLLRNYHLTANNCEHFVTFCATGCWGSEQVSNQMFEMTMGALCVLLPTPSPLVHMISQLAQMLAGMTWCFTEALCGSLLIVETAVLILYDIFSLPAHSFSFAKVKDILRLRLTEMAPDIAVSVVFMLISLLLIPTGLPSLLFALFGLIVHCILRFAARPFFHRRFEHAKFREHELFSNWDYDHIAYFIEPAFPLGCHFTATQLAARLAQHGLNGKALCDLAHTSLSALNAGLSVALADQPAILKAAEIQMGIIFGLPDKHPELAPPPSHVRLRCFINHQSEKDLPQPPSLPPPLLQPNQPSTNSVCEHISTLLRPPLVPPLDMLPNEKSILVSVDDCNNIEHFLDVAFNCFGPAVKKHPWILYFREVLSPPGTEFFMLMASADMLVDDPADPDGKKIPNPKLFTCPGIEYEYRLELRVPPSRGCVVL